MLDHFLVMKDERGEPASLGEIVVEGGNIIGAGADTTSIGMRTMLGQLLLHDDAYARVQREMDVAYVEHGFSDEPSRGMSFAVAEELPFLRCG